MNEDREIWSSALAEILDILGRDVTDSLVFSHLYLQAKNTSMPQMANAMLDVEDILWSGKYYEEVKGTFVKYGILEWSVSLPDDKSIEGVVSVKNASSWSKGEGDLIIEVQSKEVKEVNLYNVAGQQIYSMKVNGSGNYYIPSYICGSGIYFLQISTTSNSDITKLFHY